MPITEAQQRANVKYRKKSYDRIEVTVSKGKKDEIKTYAESRNETLNGFINRLIDEEMQKNKP